MLAALPAPRLESLNSSSRVKGLGQAREPHAAAPFDAAAAWVSGRLQAHEELVVVQERGTWFARIYDTNTERLLDQAEGRWHGEATTALASRISRSGRSQPDPVAALTEWRKSKRDGPPDVPLDRPAASAPQPSAFLYKTLDDWADAIRNSQNGAEAAHAGTHESAHDMPAVTTVSTRTNPEPIPFAAEKAMSGLARVVRDSATNPLPNQHPEAAAMPSGDG